MEKIVNKTTEEKEKVIYKAIDGTVFLTEKNCQEYEDSAICVIGSRIKKTETDAWSLCYNDSDNRIEIIRGSANDVKMYVACRKKETIWKAATQSAEDFIKSELKDNDTTIIFENCDGYPYLFITVKQLIEKINNDIAKSFEKNEN